MFGNESLFGLELVLLLGIVIIVLVSFNAIMRKLLKVERKKFFSYNHVNDKHAKLDWTVRIAFIVVLLSGFIINSRRGPSEWLWFLETWFLLIVFIVASETARAVMEWKYAENRNAYILTLSQLVFAVTDFPNEKAHSF